MTGEVCANVADAPGAFDVWIPFFVEIRPMSLLARIVQMVQLRRPRKSFPSPVSHWRARVRAFQDDNAGATHGDVLDL